MSCCTFFGHRDCPGEVKPKLKAALVRLIRDHGVDRFYVGRQGDFDAMVLSTLRQLAAEYPIRYAVVLETLPGKGEESSSETLLPEGMEAVHPRYAIAQRNRWMLEQSSYVVAYVTHPWGGAAGFLRKAVRQKKTIINLGDRESPR